MAQQLDVIGSRAPRLDAPAKATGQAVFADDLSFPGMLHGAILQSPHPHARVLSVDASAARRLPGVRAVITAAEVGAVKYGVSPARYDETLFATDKVRYVGDEIAAVAAVDLATALEALALIKVDYDPLPAVFDPLEALAQGAPVIHDEFPGNVCAEVHQEFGEVEAALARADYVRTDSLKNKRQDGGFIETHCAVAVPDLNGRVTLYSATQVPHYVQRNVAMVLGLELSKLRVVKPYVGGGFGPKAEATPLDYCSTALALRTGKPVKMAYTREQVFLHSRARHQFIHEMTTGVTRDGKLLALKHRAILDGGAYTSFGIATVYYSGSLLGGPYRLANMKYDGLRAFTNKPACGAQRGHGGVIARALFERQLDLIAKELGIDPVRMRLDNMMEVGDVTCNDLNMSSLGMRECIEAVRDGSDWGAKKGKLPRGKGIGAACGFFVSGAGYPIYRSETYHSTVTLKVDEDGGGVKVLSASAEIGQGSDTVLGMIAAESLGVPLELVRVESGSTDFGVDLGAYSSRQTLMSGHACRDAALMAKGRILSSVAAELGVNPADLDFRNGVLVSRGPDLDIAPLRTRYRKEHRGWPNLPDGEGLSFAEAARIAFLAQGSIVGTGQYKPPQLGGKYKGAAVGTSPAYGCSAQVVEVAVDLETGQVRVESITDAHDCGRAINRTAVEGQMEGSISMGLGEALFEEVKFDQKGRVVNPSLGEYHLPTIQDMPAMKCIVVESDEPNGPFGAKEVGEGAIMPTIPAILNAVFDATGAVITELPLTPERVLRAIRQAQAEKK
ncbi:MAG: molybdopterin-dependent oxidoreductase [Desulfarculus sp.]|nr:molybdopterin-dependent oxidoreductase [Desulfarculus sp.]